MTRLTLATAVVCAGALTGTAVAGNETQITASEVVQAFGSNGIDLCRVVICTGLVDTDHHTRAWETNFNDDGVTLNVYVLLGEDGVSASSALELIGGSSQYGGDTIGRFENVSVIVGR